MRIIDGHMHYSNIASFAACAESESHVAYSREGYLRECAENGVVASVCMGLSETLRYGFPDACAETPMLADLSADLPEQLYLCPGINPHRLDEANLRALEATLRDPRTVGIKIYAGYYHFDIFDARYAPVYRLALEYGLPVVLHSGDTFSDRGLLAYAHPLHVDRLAVQFRDLPIVISHLGAPWMIDAVEVAYKNTNVWLDLSGLLVGDGPAIHRYSDDPRQHGRFLEALGFWGEYGKVVFGTDWPLAQMGAYIEFVKSIVPEAQWPAVFYDNALRLFSRIRVDGE